MPLDEQTRAAQQPLNHDEIEQLLTTDRDPADTPIRRAQLRASEIKIMVRDPNDLLRRQALAQALTEAGFPTSPATLATKATRGGGPPFRLYGRIPLYRWSDALSWAESRLSAPRRSTSEGDVGAAATPMVS